MCHNEVENCDANREEAMADDIGKTTLIGEERCPGTSYSDLLDQDSREVPDFLREEAFEYL